MDCRGLRSARRRHGLPGFLSLGVSFLVGVEDAVAVGISLEDPPRILEGVVMIARVVALNLRDVILLRVLRVVLGFFPIALCLLCLQDCLLLGNPRGFRQVGLIDADGGLLCRRRVGPVRIDHVALGINRLVHFISLRWAGQTHREGERQEDKAALSKS
jgi:hypothetical protein